MQGKKVVDILPKDGYINALKNLKRPEIKKKTVIILWYVVFSAGLDTKCGFEYSCIKEGLCKQWEDRLEPGNDIRI